MQAQQACNNNKRSRDCDAETNKETQAKIAIEQAKISYEIQKLNAEKKLKLALMEEEFQYNMQLKGREQSQIDAREKKKRR